MNHGADQINELIKKITDSNELKKIKTCVDNVLDSLDKISMQQNIIQRLKESDEFTLCPDLESLVNSLRINYYKKRCNGVSDQIKWKITISDQVELMYELDSVHNKCHSSLSYSLNGKRPWYELINDCTLLYELIDDSILLEDNCTEYEPMIKGADEILNFLGFDISTNTFILFLCHLSTNIY